MTPSVAAGVLLCVLFGSLNMLKITVCELLRGPEGSSASACPSVAMASWLLQALCLTKLQAELCEIWPAPKHNCTEQTACTATVHNARWLRAVVLVAVHCTTTVCIWAGAVGQGGARLANFARLALSLASLWQQSPLLVGARDVS